MTLMDLLSTHLRIGPKSINALALRIRLRRLRHTRFWVSTQRIHHLPETFGMAQVLKATRIDLLAQPIVHSELLTKSFLA